MKTNIDQTIRRTQSYWYTDGLAEIAVGAVMALLGLLYLPMLWLPGGAAALAIGLGQPLLLLLGIWLSGKAVRALKERITYPRTGYVAYPPKKDRKARSRAAITALVVAVFVVILQTLLENREQLIPVVVGAFIALSIALLGYRLGLARFYLLALFALLLGILTRWLGLTDLLQTAFYFTGLGLGWIVSGAFTLMKYLRNTSPAGPEEI